MARVRLPGRAPKASSAPTTSAVRKGRARLDRVTDALGPQALRLRFGALQRRLGLTALGAVALLAFVGLWLVARIVAGTAMYLFAYGAFLLVIVSFVIAPRNLKLAGTREGLFPRGREGDRFDVRLVLSASRRVSTFMLEERVPELLGKTVKLPITRLGKGEEVEHRYTLRCARRGVFQIGPLVAVASDPLGLVERETVVSDSFELIVHPRLELVSDRPLTRAHEDPPIRPPISRPWPSGSEFYGMREYVPGDDVRRIVWRASARAQKILVRESEQGITDKVTIILDTDRGSHSRDGEGLSESFEVAVRAAASLGVRHLREGYEVSTEVNGGPLTRPLRGAASQTILLDNMARVDTDREPLTKTFMRMVATPQRGSHNILITPKLSATEAAQLRLLLNTGVSIFVVALLWDEENATTLATAAAMGCQVVGVRPGDDLSAALYQSGVSVS